jgi:hypothetical protein
VAWIGTGGAVSCACAGTANDSASVSARWRVRLALVLQGRVRMAQEYRGVSRQTIGLIPEAASMFIRGDAALTVNLVLILPLGVDDVFDGLAGHVGADLAQHVAHDGVGFALGGVVGGDDDARVAPQRTGAR